MKQLIRVLSCVCAVFYAGTNLFAAEGGSGVYALGFIAPQAGFTPDPGTYFSYNFYQYKGNVSVDVSLGSQIAIPGSDLQISAQANGNIKPDVDLDGHLFGLTHIFENKILGGNAGLVLVVPYIKADLDLMGSSALSLTGPRGNTLTIPFNGNVEGSDKGIGDSTVTALLGWHDKCMHYITMMNLYIPTGGYDSHNLVNVSKNHWALEPMGAITYLNEKNGREFSGALGFTFNWENSKTDYKTGIESHLDLAAIQHFSANFYVGLVGYAYQQLTGDSGSGAKSDFKGQVYGLGPVIGGMIPLGIKQQLILNARYYQEFDAENRLKGKTLFMTAVVKF